MAETTSLCPSSDPKSPYYCNPDEQWEYFRSMTKLSQAEDNYVFWKRRFRSILVITKKLGFIDGSIEKPESSSPLYPLWEQCDATVMSWMMSSMTEDVLKFVVYAETAQKMWEDLRRLFVPSVELKIYQLRQSLAMMRQNGDSVAKYFGKLNKAWVELAEYDPVPECSCGGCKCEIAKRARETRENEQRFAFLMGLNPSLSAVKMRVILMKPPPSLYEAYGMAVREELMMKTTRRR